MPVVSEVEISVRQKKLMFADIMSELELCSDLDEVKNWNLECERELEKITNNWTDLDWIEVINEQIEQQKQLITLKQEMNICQQ